MCGAQEAWVYSANGSNWPPYSCPGGGVSHLPSVYCFSSPLLDDQHNQPLPFPVQLFNSWLGCNHEFTRVTHIHGRSPVSWTHPKCLPQRLESSLDFYEKPTPHHIRPTSHMIGILLSLEYRATMHRLQFMSSGHSFLRSVCWRIVNSPIFGINYTERRLGIWFENSGADTNIP